MNEHRMHLDPAHYGRFCEADHHFEYRLHDAKRRVIEVGDVIVFSHRATGDECRRVVQQKHLAPSFDALEMIDEVDIMRLRLRYGLAQEKEFGVVALELTRK